MNLGNVSYMVTLLPPGDILPRSCYILLLGLRTSPSVDRLVYGPLNGGSQVPKDVSMLVGFEYGHRHQEFQRVAIKYARTEQFQPPSAELTQFRRFGTSFSECRRVPRPLASKFQSSNFMGRTLEKAFFPSNLASVQMWIRRVNQVFH